MIGKSKRYIKKADILSKFKDPTNPWVAATLGGLGAGSIGLVASLLASGKSKNVILSTLISALAGAGLGAAVAHVWRRYNIPGDVPVNITPPELRQPPARAREYPIEEPSTSIYATTPVSFTPVPPPPLVSGIPAVPLTEPATELPPPSIQDAFLMSGIRQRIDEDFQKMLEKLDPQLIEKLHAYSTADVLDKLRELQPKGLRKWKLE